MQTPAMLLVANKGDRMLGVVDPGAGRQVATIAENGITGHEVAASPMASWRMSQSMETPGSGSPAPTAVTWL